MSQIIVKKRKKNQYSAESSTTPSKIAFGKTETEAIGKLVMEFPEVFQTEIINWKPMWLRQEKRVYGIIPIEKIPHKKGVPVNIELERPGERNAFGILELNDRRKFTNGSNCTIQSEPGTKMFLMYFFLDKKTGKIYVTNENWLSKIA
jgi:hypothetical protein